MKRRTILQSALPGAALSGAAALAAPRVVRAQGQATLAFVPQADLANLAPVWSTSDVSRNHVHAVVRREEGGREEGVRLARLSGSRGQS